MPRRLRSIAVMAALGLLLCGAASAAPTPASGTLSPVTPTLTYTDGPFTGANPSNNVPGSNGPNCSLVPGTCSDYLLTVSIPAGYSVLHPNDVVTIKAEWPTATGNDFDVYILDPVTGAAVQQGSASSADPEIASFHVSDGTVTYDVRVAVFQAANESITGTITLGPPSAGTPGLGHSYSIGTDLWSCNMHLNGTNPTGPPPTFDHSADGEPLTAFDKNGRFYVSALDGVGAGCGVWYSDDACGQAYTFVGTPDAGIGGGDAEIRTAPEKNVLGNYNVYTSSLSLANITTAVSFDGGNTFTTTPISSYTPVLDRNWNATYGPSICYLSFVNGATQPGNVMEVVRMDYSGLGAPVISPPSIVWDPQRVDPNLSHQKGNIVTDRRPGANTLLLAAGPNGEGNVYQCWNESGQRVFVSVSTDFGTTWNHKLVWDGGVGASYDHIFTWLAVDDQGNLYIVFSDDRNVYLSTSTDHANTWSRPVRVNRGGGESNACIFPQIAAGSPGRVVMCFYGTSATSPADPSAVWAVYASRSENALAAAPDFEEVKVNDRPFHSGAVCESGLNCTSGRELSDNFDLDINPVDGSAGLAYGVFGGSGTYIARQVNGISAYATKAVADRSASCPTPANACSTLVVDNGNPCVGPDYVTVVTDPNGTADVPPVPQASEDIIAVGVGEPVGVGNSLVFSIHVSNLDPANLPPNVFWRAIWMGPGGQRYVDVTNCATGGLSANYGHFTTGSVRDGAADAFSVGSDGRIKITIAKSKVDNPAAGTILTAINADCRTIAGTCPVTAGAFAPNDVTSSGQYKLVGNAFCGPVATLISRFEATPAGAGVRLSWSALPGSGIQAWNLSRGLTPGGPFELVHTTPAQTLSDDALVWQDAPGLGTFYYRLTGLGATGAEIASASSTVQTAHVSLELSLRTTGGNPFHGSTSLSYSIPNPSQVRVEVYNVAGQRVRTLVDRQDAAGMHAVSFSLRDGQQAALPVGVYLVRLTAGSRSTSTRVIALR